MVYVFYYKMSERLTKAAFNKWMQLMPDFIQEKIEKFRNLQDAERSLIGNILLLQGLEQLECTQYLLKNLKYTSFQKPYFDDLISFNISHSGDYVVCAISKTNIVGVDIEEMINIPIVDFEYLFAKEEWNEVLIAENKWEAFYILWAKKEAFLKAVGCGLSEPLNAVIIKNNAINWQNKEWYLMDIQLGDAYKCYICCDFSNPSIKINQLFLNTI